MLSGAIIKSPKYYTFFIKVVKVIKVISRKYIVFHIINFPLVPYKYLKYLLVTEHESKKSYTYYLLVIYYRSNETRSRVFLQFFFRLKEVTDSYVRNIPIVMDSGLTWNISFNGQASISQWNCRHVTNFSWLCPACAIGPLQYIEMKLTKCNLIFWSCNIYAEMRKSYCL